MKAGKKKRKPLPTDLTQFQNINSFDRHLREAGLVVGARQVGVAHVGRCKNTEQVVGVRRVDVLQPVPVEDDDVASGRQFVLLGLPVLDEISAVLPLASPLVARIFHFVRVGFEGQTPAAEDHVCPVALKPKIVTL